MTRRPGGRQRAAAAAALLATGLAAACGSPPTQVFTLSASADRGGATPARPAGAAAPVLVERATVAGYFDRTQMVTRVGPYRLSLHEFAVWGEPIADLITRALVDDLARRLGGDRVFAAAPGPDPERPDWRVGVDVLRFDVDEAGDAVVDARWTLTGPGDRPVARRRERIVTRAANAADAGSRVAALREAIAELAERIAAADPAPPRVR